MKILLGIPTGGTPATPFLQSLEHLVLPEATTAFERYVVTGNFVPAQRELIVAKAIAVGADILVMVDDDMVLPADALQRLAATLESQPRCGLVGALYYSRDGFRPMAVDNWDPDDTTTATIPAFTDVPVPVAGIGFGCVAIRMEALAEFEPLYFAAHVFVEPRTARVRVCDEDYLFCHRLRSRNWNVILDAGVRCGHYDRASNIIHPLIWEPSDITNARRIAVLQNGSPQLVPAQEAPSRGEYHLHVDLDYVTPAR